MSKGAMNFEATGRVSIWVARMASEEAFIAYTTFVYDEDGEAACPFGEDTGLGWFDEDFLEVVFFPNGVPDPLTVAFHADISAGSFASVFVKEAAAAVNVARAGANALFLLYDCAYSPDAAKHGSENGLRFVGAFDYDYGKAPGV